jgi:hypothetical protein
MEWCVGGRWETQVCQAALKCNTALLCAPAHVLISQFVISLVGVVHVSVACQEGRWCTAQSTGFAWWLTVHTHGSVLACNDAWGLLCTLLSVGARQADHTELRADHLHPRNSCRTRGSCVLGLARGPLMLISNRG